MLELRELHTRIRLHPRAILLAGTLDDKLKGGLPGSQPHYIGSGVTRVAFNDATGDPIVINPGSIQAEVKLKEMEHPMPSVYCGGSPDNTIQLTIGERNCGQVAIHLVRVIREFGEVVRRLSDSKAHVIVAGLPTQTPGNYGVPVGRIFPMGIFALDGSPLWIFPDALLAGVIKSPYPAGQKERATSQMGAVGTSGKPQWYESLENVASMVNGVKTPYDKQQFIFNLHAQNLVKQLQAKSVHEGMIMALNEYKALGCEVVPKPPESVAKARKAPPAPKAKQAAAKPKATPQKAAKPKAKSKR